MMFTISESRFLDANELGRLATTTPHGAPHVVPVCYVYDKGNLWVAVDYGTGKLRNLRAHRVAAIVVDTLNPNRGLMIQGNTDIIESGTEYRAIYALFYRRFSWVRSDPWSEMEAPFVKISPTAKYSWGLG
jgi:nitroimidazol reductase NimA-like FMN-containing flavoprotein (pyridoxamine 5'-phosphate oxidase superfamily)